MRKLIATLMLTAALAVGSTAPAASAAPVITGGLVNVTVTNVLNGNTVIVSRVVNVAAALNIAANVCDVSVGVLAQQLHTGEATCSNVNEPASAVINQP
jgi:hypothetical protein